MTGKVPSAAENAAPGADEAEISVFGPGLGECIVVHLTGGRWMVVDSCLDATGEPIALQYLRRLGVSPNAIELIVVTHWHDDHIRGVGRLLEVATQARMSCSIALHTEEFRKLLMAGRAPFAKGFGTHEFDRMFQILILRSSGRAASVGPEWAIEGKALIDDVRVKVIPLSPSDGTVTLSHRALEALLPKVGPQLRRLVAQGPNSIAVALKVQIGGLHALLGSDLEHTPDVRTGWNAVLSSRSAAGWQAQLVKIPHHGSSNADHPNVWKQLLRKDCLGVVTPFNQGKVAIPKQEDLARLVARAGSLYITAEVGGRRSKRSPEIEKEIRQVTRLRTLTRSMGHVRIRCKDNQPIAVETFEGAHRVTSSY